MAKVVRPSCICGGGIVTALRLRVPSSSSSSSSSSSFGVIGLNQRSRRVLLAPIAAATTISSTKPNNSHLMMMTTIGRRSFRASSTTHNNNNHHHVNDSGSIDSPLINSMQTKIKEQLNAESVIVKDAYGDGRHVSIDVISSVFEGESAVSRQRMVYKAIWEELQNAVHAVDQMTTKTPSEAATNK